ncbi:MAG: sodium/glutamate symporter [Ancylobacter novellus]|uniref:Sodium/glutamate symporter n=1 Tax=Ancylobacter novellus TaxID=921 RepID=A0A2W5R090_ANCNO|nr:MAG: sodium/glutamate symporter [Ancylobacter novellus]
MTTLQTPGLLTFTIAILVFFAGAGINRAIPALRTFNIPEAVTGGLLTAMVTLIAYRFFGVEISFALEARDMLLLYFFTGIGLNAKLDDLISGGRPLLVLLILTVVYLMLQNLIAAGSVALLGLPEGLTVFLGSASLIGGHGTTIAWAPLIAERFHVANAMEVGIAVATLGLVVASLVGGPIARHLITRYDLKGPKAEVAVVGLPQKSGGPAHEDVSHVSLLRTVLVLNVAILIGYIVDELLEDVALKLPMFVVCLLVAIVMTNTIPRLMPHLVWPTRTRALALVSDFSLNVFLSMSLMSMQLWTLGGLGTSLVIVLGVQTVAAVVYIIFVVFPAMGKNYEAAVLSAGFTGISLGATPTAIANMTAVTKAHGSAARAFIILPLVSAFFIDIINAAVIGYIAR